MTPDESKKFERTVGLVSDQLRPVEIARNLKISLPEVIHYLNVAIARGRLSRSDVFFCLDEKFRTTMEESGSQLEKMEEWLMLLTLKTGYKIDVTAEELSLYFSYSGRHVRMTDLYELISELEYTLHTKIKHVLVQKFGKGERGWWRKGVPENVRADCAAAQERDTDFYEDPYGYTTLIHLATILVKQWEIFMSRVPLEIAKDKKLLEKNLKKLNSIRNRVMHPVRGGPPTEQDFEFVKSMRQKLKQSLWRLA